MGKVFEDYEGETTMKVEILYNPNDEPIEKALKWADKVLDGVDLNEELPDEKNT